MGERTLTGGMLSIVVPTRNRGDISECLEHLLAVEYRPLEIVVVDQSEDHSSTRVCVEDLRSQSAENAVSLLYSPSDRMGLDAARNDGAEGSKGEWIAFVDDDCLVEPKWGQEIVEGFAVSSNVGMVFGRTQPYYPPQPGKRTRISIKDWPDEKRLRSRLSLVNRSAGMGGNMAISRKAFARTGPFEELLDHGTDLPGAGDFEMSFRVLKCGCEVVYTPSAICKHKRWLPEEEYLETETGYSMARAAAWAKHAKAGDSIAIVSLLCELGRRLIEIPYHILITRESRNIRRAVVRTKGFMRGAIKGLLKEW